MTPQRADYVIIHYAHVICPRGHINMQLCWPASASSRASSAAAAETAAMLSYDDNGFTEGH